MWKCCLCFPSPGCTLCLSYVLKHPPHDTTQLIIMLVRSDYLVSFSRKSCTQLGTYECTYECKGESGHIWAECSGCTTRPRFLTPTPMNASLYYPCDSSSGLPQCGKHCVQSLSRQQDVTDAADACPEPQRLGSLKSHSFSFAVIQLFIFWPCTMFLSIAFFLCYLYCVVLDCSRSFFLDWDCSYFAVCTGKHWHQTSFVNFTMHSTRSWACGK